MIVCFRNTLTSLRRATQTLLSGGTRTRSRWWATTSPSPLLRSTPAPSQVNGFLHETCYAVGNTTESLVWRVAQRSGSGNGKLQPRAAARTLRERSQFSGGLERAHLRPWPSSVRVTARSTGRLATVHLGSVPCPWGVLWCSYWRHRPPWLLLCRRSRASGMLKICQPTTELPVIVVTELSTV